MGGSEEVSEASWGLSWKMLARGLRFFGSFLDMLATRWRTRGARWRHDGPKMGHDSAKMGNDSAKIGILSSTWELMGQFWEYFFDDFRRCVGKRT